jgi:hypothetical protein
MKTSDRQDKKFNKVVAKTVVAIIFTALIGGISMAPAFGRDDNGRHKGHYKHGRYEHGRYEHGRRVYQPPRDYYYPAPVYAPPPVIYAPAPYQSPGISFVFPIRIR